MAVSVMVPPVMAAWVIVGPLISAWVIVHATSADERILSPDSDPAAAYSPAG